MKAIAVRGEQIFVDDEDYARLSAHQWRLNGKGYAIRTAINPEDGTKTIISMHRDVLGVVDRTASVDHIDANKLNNQRSNLRVCTSAQNMQNRKRHSNNKSGFKGVTFHTATRKWGAEVKCNGKRRWLGVFETPQLAHEVYCLAADMLHGEFANHG